MRIMMIILGIVMILAGGVWFLQGINIIPGSFMTGQTQWAIYGVLTIVLGAVILVFANRRKTSSRK